METTEGGMELTQEIIEHMMNPKNYGKLDDPTGVGIGYDEKTGEYVIFYLRTDGDDITAVSFATNGCQDTVILGSIFTEMIKETTIDDARKTAQSMQEKLAASSAKQQACADMVLSAFIAALLNREHRIDGGDQEMHKIKIENSCDIEEETPQ